MKYIKKLCFSFSLILYKLIICIRPLIQIRFLMIETSAIGHMCEPIETHYLEKKN